jgi:hypothetical protein
LLTIGWPQLEQASFASPPIRTSNTIRNSAAAGAVVGTPGTLPTYWGQSQNTGIVLSVIGFGIDGGIDYLDVRLVGTTAAGTQNNIVFESGALIAASAGQTWITSVYYKLVAGSLANISAINVVTSGNNSGGSGIEFAITAGPSPTAVWQRATSTGMLANALTTYVQPLLQIASQAAPAAIDITLRIGWPQLEQSASASPPQRTVAGTVGVNTPAEVVTLTSPPAFGSAYSLYGAGTPYAPSSRSPRQSILARSDAAIGNLIELTKLGPGNNAQGIVAPGSNFGGANLWITGGSAKIAAAFASSDQAMSFAANAVETGATVTLPAGMDQVVIGNIRGGQLECWDGDITEFAIWPTTRISNANLISGTQ